MTCADTNNDGVLNRRQAEALLLAADGEADKHSVAALVDKIDMDGSGVIDYLKLHRVLGVGPMGLPGSPPALPLVPPAAGASGDPDGPTADARDGSFELGEVRAAEAPKRTTWRRPPCAPVAPPEHAQRLRRACGSQRLTNRTDEPRSLARCAADREARGERAVDERAATASRRCEAARAHGCTVRTPARALHTNGTPCHMRFGLLRVAAAAARTRRRSMRFRLSSPCCSRGPKARGAAARDGP
jgi:hypothetical protein